MADKKIAKPVGAVQMRVKEPFKHGNTLYAKDDIKSFGQGALKKYAANLEAVKVTKK